MRRVWPAILALALSAPSAAAIDAETAKPYEMHVLVRVGAHRLLTPT